MQPPTQPGAPDVHDQATAVMSLQSLHAGMRVRLPSGNRVMLLAAEGADWICAYLDGSRARGEVHLARAWIVRHCTVAT
jgi:hypothetical protein